MTTRLAGVSLWLGTIVFVQPTVVKKIPLVGVVGIYLPRENEESLVSGMMRAATPAWDAPACGARGDFSNPPCVIVLKPKPTDQISSPNHIIKASKRSKMGRVVIER